MIKRLNNVFCKVFIVLLVICSIGCNNEGSNNKETMKTESNNPILFVGTYTQKEGHVDGKGEGIYVYEMNAETGELSYLNKVSGITNPSFLTVHPNDKLVFAVSETPNGGVHSYAYDGETNGLKLINHVPANGDAPCYISVTDDGTLALVANYVTGNVGMHVIKPSGMLEEATAVLQHKGKGPHWRQDTPHAHFIQQYPLENYALAADLGIDKIAIYQLDLQGKGMIRHSSDISTEAGAGPRHITFHPDPSVFYVVNELNGTIEAFKKDSTKMDFNRIQTISTLKDGGSEGSCADIHIHKSGRFLYASNRGADNDIAMYSVDPDTKMLTLIGHQSTKGKTPRNFIIDPSGKFLLVANQDEGGVVSFKINQNTGVLEETGFVSNIPTPVCLKFL